MKYVIRSAAEFGEALGIFRARKGMSQTDVSTLLSCQQQTVSHWEHGHMPQPIEKLIAVLDLYDAELVIRSKKG